MRIFIYYNNLLILKIAIFLALFCFNYDKEKGTEHVPVSYYIDSRYGNDLNSGTSENSPWKSFARLEKIKLLPGVYIRFKRGSTFHEPLFIYSSGTAGNYITLTDYGDPLSPAPAFTNKQFEQDNFGNCIRVKGSFVIIEDLYFHNTTSFKPGEYTSDGGWIIWEMGAIYIDKTATNCIVRNNEIFDCPVGIKSYGLHTLITNNYIHDCNRVLSEWNWGAIGIWLGNDYQEVSYNRIFNYRTEHANLTYGGADGSAIEVDDSRFAKSHISIHHNFSKDCQGFLETTSKETGITVTFPDYRGFSIHHNISDDYQQFLLIWAGSDFSIDHNTIIRRKINSNELGVFVSTEQNARNKIRNNIIITENVPIFNFRRKAKPNNIIHNNLYYASSGELVMGNEGPGVNAVFANPLLKNYSLAANAHDFMLSPGSPAIDRGENLLYKSDFLNYKMPFGKGPDLGAFEYQSE